MQMPNMFQSTCLNGAVSLSSAQNGRTTKMAIAQWPSTYTVCSANTHKYITSGVGQFAICCCCCGCCRHIPAPSGRSQDPLQLRLFDASHDEYRGVICLVAVVHGHLRAGDKLQAVSTGQQYEALEVWWKTCPWSWGLLCLGWILRTGARPVTVQFLALF